MTNEAFAGQITGVEFEDGIPFGEDAPAPRQAGTYITVRLDDSDRGVWPARLSMREIGAHAEPTPPRLPVEAEDDTLRKAGVRAAETFLENYHRTKALEAALAVAPEKGDPVVTEDAHDEGMDAVDWDMVRDGVGDPQEAASIAVRAALAAALAVATEPVDHSELIAEAEGRGCPYETCTCDGRLIRRLADALEGVEK